MGFSRQEYWSGLPSPPSGDLPHPGIEPTCPPLAGRCFTSEPPGKPTEKHSQGLLFLMPPGRRASRDPAGYLCPPILNFQDVLERCAFVSLAFISCTGKLLLSIMFSLDGLSPATANPTLACRDTIQDKPTIVAQSLEVVIGSRGRLGIQKGPIRIVLGEQLLCG